MNHDFQPTQFPLCLSANRRHLQDASGRPFFYHADTGWRLLMSLTRDEALHYLDDRMARGFNTLHLHAVNKEVEGTSNRAGHEPFEGDDLTRPVEAYWRHVDDMLGEATARGFFLAISAAWLGCGTGDYRDVLNLQNAPVYGRFLGERFGGFNNILWILGGDDNPRPQNHDATISLAHALRESAPQHLLTYHAAAEHSSALFFGDQPWLDINTAYTYGAAALHIRPEWERTPIRPIVLLETGYQGESNKDFLWTPGMVRRQPYDAVLSGACGHANGNGSVWKFAANWREALDDQATRHMTFVRELFESRAWWRLVPDFEHRLVTRGRASFQGAHDISAACADDGSFALVYVPTPRRFTVDVRALNGPVRAAWFDPTSGAQHEIEGAPLEPQPREFEPPPRNDAGDGDFILILDFFEIGSNAGHIKGQVSTFKLSS